MDVGGLLGNEAIRARLDAAAAQDRFSHSYLICGPDGSGKHTLAKILAAAMQCTGAGRKPCGRCEGCRKVFEGVHPDVITVNDPAHKTIAVDVIRQMRADVFLRPNEGKRKIYLIEQDMAEPPQNALLKILEAIDLTACVEKRTSAGGPAKVQEQIDYVTACLAKGDF